ncbi:MAG TPA: homoserine dehydrogenase [Rhodanobacteraceae bacterium]|nr:homoserine dehydrogenase [Rhodanobacteraceae bacterium]
MSALPKFVGLRLADARSDTAVVLLGAGVVGGALLRLLASGGHGVRLVGLANSTRQCVDADGLDFDAAPALLAQASVGRSDDTLLAALDASGAARRVVIDATASPEIAASHADWLWRGYAVVTANKVAAAAPSDAWRALRAACVRGAAYGDAATVGAGLPVLATLRRLHACGDALVAIEGVFSGSLSWLFNQYDGTRPFSSLLREARAWGYTEPDPRVDLCGADVARKLVILARAAGHAIDVGDVAIESLVPASLRDLDVETFLARADELDATMAERHRAAVAQGYCLRHLATFDANGRAHVGLVAVGADHPAARLSGADNLFALTTQRYRARPLVIQGPGAGADVTAQALLGDLLALEPARFAA